MDTRSSFHVARQLRHVLVALPAFAAALGLCLTVASPLAAPRQDHALLMELANRELAHCQDELGKLRRIGASDDQSVDQSIKTMAAQLAAAAEAQCQKLKAAIDAAAEPDAERRTSDTAAPRPSPGPPLAQQNQNTPAPAVTAKDTPAPTPSLPPGQHKAVAAQPAAGEPTAPAVQASAVMLAIHFAAASEQARGAADALAARFGSGFQRAKTHAEPETPPTALVRYSDQADREVATSIAHELAQHRYPWRLERQAAGKSSATERSVEVWIPAAQRNPATDAGPSESGPRRSRKR
ncbi:MAG: hypothetical protein JO047_04640 [Alphaproteobacteria bacterium]|nr:hypothetical protein [Alphaproteobacteria bacterium]